MDIDIYYINLHLFTFIYLESLLHKVCDGGLPIIIIIITHSRQGAKFPPARLPACQWQVKSNEGG